MKAGLAIPQFAVPGVGDFRTPALESVDWPLMRDLAVEADERGFDSIWVADHLFLGVDDVFYECVATLAGLAAVTDRVRLGTIHFGLGFRYPGVAAKELATIDQISGGRLEVFVDPGWRRREFEAFGVPWIDDPAERLAAFDEALGIILDIWDGTRPQREGSFHRVAGAPPSPPPFQQPHPRIWLGEAVDEVQLDLVARRADVWNSIPATPEVLASKIERVDEACRRVGRDPATLPRTLETQVLIRRGEGEIDRWFSENDSRFEQHRDAHEPRMRDVIEFIQTLDPNASWPPTRDTLETQFLIGTPDHVVQQLRAYKELGISEVIFWCMDIPDRTSMDLLIDEVLPRV